MPDPSMSQSATSGVPYCEQCGERTVRAPAESLCWKCAEPPEPEAVGQLGDSRRERAIEAARKATALLFYNRNAATAVADAVLKVADDAEIARQIKELEAMRRA